MLVGRGREVGVGGIGVFVGKGVFVGLGVAVGGTGVLVGIGVFVGGIGVFVGAGQEDMRLAVVPYVKRSVTIVSRLIAELKLAKL
jgi:hypothetical protein